MSTKHHRLRRLVDGHFSGGLAADDEASLREHLVTCGPCRQAYEAYLVAERLDPRAPAPRERLGRALGLEAPAPRGRGWRRLAGGALALAGATALVLVLGRASPNTPSPVSRGPTVAASQPLEVAVFEVRDDRQARRVTDVVQGSDELAFAYRNELGKGFLMIFAIEADGRVLWFHPAWTDPADNPAAVPIDRQIGLRELPEAIRHPLRGPRLTLHALFADQPLDVRTVEARIAAGGLVADARAGEVLRTLELEVRP